MPDPLEALAADEAADRQAAEAAASAQPPAATSEPQPAEPAAQAPTPPWVDKGFQTPEAVFESWQQLQRKMSEQGDELGQLRAFKQQVEQAASPQQGQGFGGIQQLPDGTPILGQDALAELAMENPLAAADLMARYRTFDLEQRMEQRFAERLAPMEKQTNEVFAQRAIDIVKAEVGDELLAKHKQVVIDALNADPDHFTDPQTRARRMADVILSAEFRSARNPQQQQARDEQGRFVPNPAQPAGATYASAPNAQTPNLTPEEQEIEALQNWRPPEDFFGRIPSAR